MNICRVRKEQTSARPPTQYKSIHVNILGLRITFQLKGAGLL